jgi:hypothetical protein
MMKKVNLAAVLTFVFTTALLFAQMKFHPYGFSGGA